MRDASRGGLRKTCRAALLAAIAFAGLLWSPVEAQQSVQDWLDRCEEQNDRRSATVTYCDVKEHGFAATGRPIAVDGRENGGIAVIGWDVDSVLVIAKIQTRAGSGAAARELARDIRLITAGGTIRADGPPMRGRDSWSVSFEIYVPDRSDLSLETHNGPIAVREVSGSIEMRAHNGPIALRGVSGDVRGRTTNGPVDVVLVGRRWQGRGLDMETSNGPIQLTIPDGYSAQLETGTTNGPMRVNFPITIQGRVTGRIATQLGSGGAPIRVITTNGPVVIRRG